MNKEAYQKQWLAITKRRAAQLRQTRRTQEDATASVEASYQEDLSALQHQYARSIGLPIGARVRVDWDGYEQYAAENGHTAHVPVLRDVTYRVAYITPAGRVALKDVSDKFNFIPPRFVTRLD